MLVAVYCRVSTEDQADAKTIENQREFAARYCSLHSLRVYEYYLDEGVSGTIPMDKRPAGSRLLEDAIKGVFSAVCVYRLDRLARTALEILRTNQRLEEANIVLKSMTENFDTSTPSGRFFMTTLGGIAEIERDTIAERMRLGKERALRDGRWPGGKPPFGYTLRNKKMIINSEEAAVVKKIFQLLNDGGMTTEAIADYLNCISITSPGESGGKRVLLKNRWHRSRVWRILAQSAYRGAFLYNIKGGAVEIPCPALISNEDWKLAQSILQKNFLNSKRNAKREYLLKGLIKCDLCGRKFYGDGSDKQGRHNYYRCGGNISSKNSHYRCGIKSVRADYLEELIWKDIFEFVLAAPHINRGAFICSESVVSEMKKIKLAIKSKKTQKKRAINLCRRQIISEGELKEELGLIFRELESLTKRMVILEQQTGIYESRDYMHHVHYRLTSAGAAEKRDLIKGLVEGITVGSDPSGVPVITIRYYYEKTDCVPAIETRGKYRLGLPKAIY